MHSSLRYTATFIFASAACFSMQSSPLFAWGDVGHMTVCDLAMTQLTDTTKAAIMKITDNQPLNLQCIWPDQVKRFKGWNYTSGYHFINYEDGSKWQPTDKIKLKDGTVQAYDNVGDMLQMIEHTKDKLLDPGINQKQRLCNLRFLGHLAGDSHQPLHVGRGSDFGGNNIKVSFNGDPLYRLRVFALKVRTDDQGNTIPDECSKQIFTPSLQCMMSQTLLVKGADGTVGPIANNLHVMWDDAMIDQRIKEMNAFPGTAFENRETLAAVKAFESDVMPTFLSRKAELHLSLNDDPLKWAEISAAIRPFAYSTQGIEDSQGFYKARIPIIKDQIQRAGYHLAGTLNMIFDPSWQVNPYVKAYLAKRKLEFDARVKAGRTTEFKTECDKL